MFMTELHDDITIVISNVICDMRHLLSEPVQNNSLAVLDAHIQMTEAFLAQDMLHFIIQEKPTPYNAKRNYV